MSQNDEVESIIRRVEEVAVRLADHDRERASLVEEQAVLRERLRVLVTGAGPAAAGSTSAVSQEAAPRPYPVRRGRRPNGGERNSVAPGADEEATRIRDALGRLDRRSFNSEYPADFQAMATRYLLRQRGAGVSWDRLAKATGLGVNTLKRWHDISTGKIQPGLVVLAEAARAEGKPVTVKWGAERLKISDKAAALRFAKAVERGLLKRLAIGLYVPPEYEEQQGGTTPQT